MASEHNGRARRIVAVSLALAAVAVGCESPTDPSTKAKTGTRAQATQGPASPAGASTAPTDQPNTQATANTGTNIHSGVDTSATTAPVETLAPVAQPTVTPTPLGAVGSPVAIGESPLFLALLRNTVRPYVLRRADLVSLDNNYRVGSTYTDGIGLAAGLAADGLQDLWVLSADPPHVDRWELGLGALGKAESFALPATPSAIAARDGEAWIGSSGGVLTRIVRSPAATASFAGFGTPTAIAVGEGHVWVTGAGGELFKVDRSTGAKVATYAVGPGPVGVAIDSAGGVWVACQGGSDSVRVSPSGATSSVPLGGPAKAVVADSRRVWFGMAGKLSYWKPDGTKEGEAPAAIQGMLGEKVYDASALAIDAYGRVWLLDRTAGDLLPIWGVSPGE